MVGGKVISDGNRKLLDIYLNRKTLTLDRNPEEPRITLREWLNSISDPEKRRNGKDLLSPPRAMLDTLYQIKIIKTPFKDVKLSVVRDPQGHVSLNIDGLKTSEKMFVFDAIEELLKPIEKPRYILVRKKPLLGRFSSVDYHSVPYLIAQNKSYVDIFSTFWNNSIGPASINYVHSLEGRALLVKARTKSYASAFKPKIDRLNVWE